jgi:hypothetical protein
MIEFEPNLLNQAITSFAHCMRSAVHKSTLRDVLVWEGRCTQFERRVGFLFGRMNANKGIVLSQ